MAKKGEGLFLVFTDLIDPKYEEEFNAWYNTEHLPELLTLPGFLMRRAMNEDVLMFFLKAAGEPGRTDLSTTSCMSS
jgi:hypothetical protein